MTSRRERFLEIYDANYTAILGYALRRTQDADDADDVVSDTFLAAWRRVNDVPSGDGARLWLYGTARKVLANHHRGQRRQGHLKTRLEAQLPVPKNQPDETAADSPNIEHIAEAFARLGEADREILVLAGWEELDGDQLALVLGCKATTARVRLHRARKRFARQFAAVAQQRPGRSGQEPDKWASVPRGAQEAL